MAIKTKSKLKAEKKFSFLKDKSAPKQEFDYWSLLYKKVNKVDDKTLTSINKKKGFEYGYNEEHDFVCISHDGTVGEFYNIQGLVVGIPKAPKKVFSRSKVKEEQYWDTEPLPNEKYAKKIKNMRHFSEIAKVATPQEKKLLKEFVDVDGIEWERRTSGFWFMNDGTPTYVTGSHYFYLRWAKIDVGSPDYREANKIFFYFWEACKADRRSYGMCYLKNRRSGFSFMASSEIVNTATQSKNSQLGIMSKTGIDAKSMFVNKVVPISLGLPFFFKPIRSGEERPKTILEYSVPSTRLTRNKLMNIVDLAEEDEIGLDEGLDTTISWKNTGDNAYDGEKLKFLSFDEIGKLEKPNNIKNAWLVHKTCLELGSRIVGKCMAGSTCNAQDKGGREFKELYNQSNLRSVKRDANGQTPSGLYSLFIPMEFGTEGFIDIYGRPIFKSPKEPVKGIDGGIIKMGVVDHWENKVKGLKAYPDSLNEYYRQYPRTEEHAFRDEAGAAIFNLNKIYEQIDFNSDIDNRANITRGNFQWVDGLDSKVKFYPSQTGRFYTSWIPETRLQNNVEYKGGLYYPGNEEYGAFGCDSYDISGTVDGSGSNGALHGLTCFNSTSGKIPSNYFFLEYICRPPTAEMFFEDVLMACFFYGMPILIENNKPRLLYHFKRRGYRAFSMNRPDRTFNQLSKSEQELGGIPNNSEDIRQAHSAAIETYIEENVGIKDIGMDETEMGRMHFNRTLEDWAKFDPSNRTRFDASISSGLALIANNKHKYAPRAPRKEVSMVMPLRMYSNQGMRSARVERNYRNENTPTSGVDNIQ